MSTSRPVRAVVGVLALCGVLLAACGDDAPAADDAAAPPDDGGAAFPVTIEHQYGETTIDAEPERVVSVGFTDQDFLLALDVTPIAVRDWYGDQPFATWPWAQDELGTAEPEVLSSAELNVEQIAGLRPDLIVGVSSGLTEEEYATLSGIAPTIAQSGAYPAYGMPWDEGLVMIGEALGRAERADDVVADIEERFATVRKGHPDFAGEATMSYVMSESEIGAYASVDPRSRLLVELGFSIPAEIDDLADGLFYTQFSLENIDRLDRDLLVWLTGEEATEERIRSHPVHDGLAVVERGAEIFLGEELGAAAGFSSPLSIPYFLDEFVPMLEAAMDGDPATGIPDGSEPSV